MEKKKGRDLALYTLEDNVYAELAAATRCDLQVTADMTEIASPFTGNAKEFLPGRYAWQISATAIVNTADKAKFLKVCIHKTKLSARFSIPDVTTLAGNCYVQNWNASGTVGAMATYKVTLIGTGELTENID